MTSSVDRFRGALLGLAVGDAVGTTVEFKAPGTFAPVTDMLGGGPFNLPAGAWTDDTSMALCLAVSLIQCRGFNPVDQLERYVRWYHDGYLSSTGAHFDIGIATAAALDRFERTGEPYPGDAAPAAGGNGPLMKLAPIALAYSERPLDALRYAAESARTTHGAPEAADACRYFAGLLVGALRGENINTLLYQGAFEPVAGVWQSQPLHPKVAAVAAGSFNHAEPPEIRGTGYVVDALEAALWALRSTSTFGEGVLAATNLGNDADTTAAICGQLAGALYGSQGIPEHWRERLVMHDEIVAFADALFGMAPVTIDSGGTSSQLAPRPPGDAYWVLPGRLLAGPYPGHASDADAQAKISAFLDAGVTCFIDLTEKGEGHLRPYAELLNTLAAERDIPVTRSRMPIRDVNVPTPSQMHATLDAIQRALEDQQTVYVHCRGGVGRTGTVVGCLLVASGTPATSVLERIALLRADTERAHRVSPETAAQRHFVESWEPGETSGRNE